MITKEHKVKIIEQLKKDDWYHTGFGLWKHSQCSSVNFRLIANPFNRGALWFFININTSEVDLTDWLSERDIPSFAPEDMEVLLLNILV